MNALTAPDDRFAAHGLRYSLFTVLDHYPQRNRSVGQLYAQVAEQCQLAESLGYDGFFVAEHHFHQYGAVPDPAVFLAALAQRTQTIRLGSAIAALSFRHPISVAESYAMVDVLSQGRLTLGVGSGYLKHEFEGHGLDAADKRERFDENLAVLRLALTGKPVHFQGKFHRLNGVAINVAPIQQPTPPIYVAVLRKEAAYYVGKQGSNIISVPYASVDNIADVQGIMDDFQRGASEAKTNPESIVCFHAHVAESDEAARARVSEAFNLYVDTRLYAKKQTYDDIMASGLSLFGSVETVAAKIVQLHGMGIRHVMLLQSFGLLAQELVLDSMRRMADEVIPRVAAQLHIPIARRKTVGSFSC